MPRVPVTGEKGPIQMRTHPVARRSHGARHRALGANRGFPGVQLGYPIAAMNDLRTAGLVPGLSDEPLPAVISPVAAVGSRTDTDSGMANALATARRLGDELPAPGQGRTALLWEALARLAAIDLSLARVIEPHLDALHIMAQARQAGVPCPRDADGTWGVFAAEGPGTRLEAARDGDRWLLTGRKPWCSLASRLDRALVTAWISQNERGLFAVDLRGPGVCTVHFGSASWVARGLNSIESGPVDFAGVEAVPVGEAGWYLTRPGFAWGGIGVAAVWFGGSVGVADRLVPRGPRTPDQLALAHLGAADAAVHAARCALRAAAADVDAGRASGSTGAMLALRVRTIVAQCAEEVLRHADHGLGPGPLATDEQHAARVADLHLYLRQWHAERDHAALGTAVLTQLCEADARASNSPAVQDAR